MHSRSRGRDHWNDVGGFERGYGTRDRIRNAGDHTVQASAIRHGNAGNFHGNGGRGSGSQLPHGGDLRLCRRTLESPGKLRLHQISQFAAQAREWRLSAVPHDQPSAIVGRRQIRHGVYASGSRQSGRRDVQGNEHGAAQCIRTRRAVVEGRVFVTLARLYYLKALRFKRFAYLRGKLQNHFAFPDAFRPSSAQVRSAVRRIEDHYVQVRGSIGLRNGGWNRSADWSPDRSSCRGTAGGLRVYTRRKNQA